MDSLIRYETVLSGDLNDDDIAAWGLGHLMYDSLRDDNSAYVVESTSRTVGSTSLLDGFTIQSAAQGGFYNLGGSAQIINCTFRQNSSMRLTGGAVHCQGGEPTFSHCVFEDNAAVVVGGAIHFTATRATLSDCRFEGNLAGEQGGAISLAQQLGVSMKRCVFAENWTPRLGGALYSEGYSLLLDTCTSPAIKPCRVERSTRADCIR